MYQISKEKVHVKKRKSGERKHVKKPKITIFTHFLKCSQVTLLSNPERFRMTFQVKEQPSSIEENRKGFINENLWGTFGWNWFRGYVANCTHKHRHTTPQTHKQRQSNTDTQQIGRAHV